jgi:NAD(P)-dependent dehydrogenase (short-subunit alcohol dehydrogenase family)
MANNNSPYSLKDKVAVITGAGQGVGQGIALALSAAGAKIIISGRTESKLHDTCAIIKKRGGTAEPVVCDVCKDEDIQKLIKASVDAFGGGIDILINNAQTVVLGPLLGNSDKDYASVMDSGPLATFRLMRAAYPYLKKSKGCIINLASSSALRWDMKNYGLYAAAKEAIRCFTRAAAHEWASDHIRVNCILPLAASPGMQWWTENNPEEAAAFVATVPAQRIGDCERDIGRTVVFLCSEDASYITAQSLVLDGGQARLA